MQPTEPELYPHSFVAYKLINHDSQCQVISQVELGQLNDCDL